MFKKVVRLFFDAIDMYKCYFISRKYKNHEKYKDMWLLSERGEEAKDNGYVFYKYLRENHPEINAWYVIDTSKKQDYDKVKNLGNIIEYNSLEHKIAFLLCKYAVSSHIGYLEPWSYRLYKLILDIKDKKIFVFLQHGVIFNDVSNAINYKKKIDLFITTTKKEYESICGPNYGFKKGVVVQTGIARYDNLNEFKVKRQILLMPTWRDNIISPSYEKNSKENMDIFISSDYYKSLESFINNKKLIDLLEKNKVDLIFYPHFEMQRFLSEFKVNSSKIILADKESYDVQNLLKESALMITDYSSVFFDFVYMHKPVIYYQNVPDYKYNKGYLDYYKDGFGEVVVNENELVNLIEEYINNSFIMKEKYMKRADSNFNYRDNKNCERIFAEIIKLKK